MNRKNEKRNENKERGKSVKWKNCVSVCTKEAVYKVDSNLAQGISSIFWRDR